MMVRLGADPSRCHSYEADEGQGRQKTKYAYKCSCCNKPIPVGPKVHLKIMKGARYTPKCCGRSANLVYAGVVGQVSYKAAVTAITNNQIKDVQPVQDTKKPNAPSSSSKLGKCFALYTKWKFKNYNRQTWISFFVSEADCTPAGASTYLSTCVKLFDQGVRPS